MSKTTQPKHGSGEQVQASAANLCSTMHEHPHSLISGLFARQFRLQALWLDLGVSTWKLCKREKEK